MFGLVVILMTIIPSSLSVVVEIAWGQTTKTPLAFTRNHLSRNVIYSSINNKYLTKCLIIKKS
jgi:hypothetical protein